MNSTVPFKTSYDHFGLEYGDRDLLSRIIEKTNELAHCSDLEMIKPYFDDINDPLILINRSAFFGYLMVMEEILPDVSQVMKWYKESLYSIWSDAVAALLLNVIKLTRDYDYVIQQILNYQDFCVEVLTLPSKIGAQFLIDIYELRGIDFFLFHYAGGETCANSDSALFDGARNVVRALKEVQRVAESKQVEHDIAQRQKRAIEIQRSFLGPDYDPSSNLSAKLKIASEKFWVDYLSVPVWQGLMPESRSELTDAFSTEYLLKSQILNNWSNVSLLLCKVVEREVGRVLFTPWRPFLSSIHWTEPSGLSKSEAKRVQSRIQTIQMLKSVAVKPTVAPTLGQLVFIAKFWNDRLMDSLTDVFIIVRKEARSRLPNVDEHVEQIGEILTDPVVNGGEKKSITEIRNSAAHPRSEGDLDWQGFSATLREVLGRPPKTLLRLLCVQMAELNNAQQDARGNALPRVL